jgi:hypothetical protein
MSDMMNDAELAKSLSKHPITNAFDVLPLSDPYQGIIGMTPQEMHISWVVVFLNI